MPGMRAAGRRRARTFSPLAWTLTAHGRGDSRREQENALCVWKKTNSEKTETEFSSVYIPRKRDLNR